MKLLALAITFFAAIATTALAADRVSYDKQCFTIDGKDTFVFSGAFHYFRVPKELWRDRFAKMKAAGCNTVETYVPWNWHEKTAPASLDEFSKIDLTDLEDFLKMAEDDFGMYVILRPGPYICAEWDTGGYPRWLLPLRPKEFPHKIWLRGDDPTYLAWCKHWYTTVAKVAVPHLITHRPDGKTGIILWQIENEYDYAPQPAEAKRGQISALAHDSRDLGIDVPLFTCITGAANYSDDPYINANVLDTANSYAGFDMNGLRRALDRVVKYQPDKMRMVTELQGGWFSEVGQNFSKQQSFTDAQINMITLTALANGVTSTNYYMFVGGTNFGDTAGHGVTSTYDYNAPIHEGGGVDKRYAAVQAIGMMLKEHGPKLARAVLDPTEVLESTDKDVKFVVRRAADGSRYIFVSTEQREGPRQGTAKLRFESGDETVVNYSLDKFGAKILYMSVTDPPRWLPDAPLAMDRPTDVPAAVTIADVLRKDDPGPLSWKPLKEGQTLEDLGIDDCRFIFYRGKLNAPQPTTTIAQQSPRMAIRGLDVSLAPTMHPADALLVNVAGKLATHDKNHEPFLIFTREQIDAGVDVSLLYENTGSDGGGRDMEARHGLTGWSISPSKVSRVRVSDWRTKQIDRFDDTSLVGTDVDDSQWDKADVETSNGEMKPNTIAIYRAIVDVSQSQLDAKQTKIRFGRIDDAGAVFVNGVAIGNADDYDQPHTFDLAANLHIGKNVIAVIVQNDGGTGGVSAGVEFELPVMPALSGLQWEYSDASAGAAGKWWSAGIEDGDWPKITLPEKSAEPKAMLSWYRLKFNLPSPRPDVWVPWKIHLEATGNGFVYLNDHPLGRYWQVGPQRDFYLPECWLKFGEQGGNVLTLSLRPINEGVALNKAEVSPYAQWAEKRDSGAHP